jgi:hypothetical protein
MAGRSARALPRLGDGAAQVASDAVGRASLRVRSERDGPPNGVVLYIIVALQRPLFEQRGELLHERNLVFVPPEDGRSSRRDKPVQTLSDHHPCVNRLRQWRSEGRCDHSCAAATRQVLSSHLKNGAFRPRLKHSLPHSNSNQNGASDRFQQFTKGALERTQHRPVDLRPCHAGRRGFESRRHPKFRFAHRPPQGRLWCFQRVAFESRNAQVDGSENFPELA